MNWLDDVVTRLAAADSWGYHGESPSATEPTALSALALLAHRRDQAAARPIAWLLSQQAADGSLGIDAAQSTPGWPTSLAVLAWQAAHGTSLASSKYSTAIQRAVTWILQIQGSHVEQTDVMGHDSTIRGWPWVEGTHSWVEPTAMHLLALKHTGHSDHIRARDAVRLLQNRLLESGGCNYGNTVVFGQQLRPHVQPTGLALLALAGEDDVTGHVQKSVDYLERELPRQAATESLCYGLLGLAAQRALPAAADAWLGAASRRILSRGPSSYKLALLALAASGAACPLIPATQARATS
ncbi:MAG: hypothetical protein HY288_05355 [Planctomycetia bacterium]|nr:hypothetical protein [Planctomycetia bacterium]